MSNFLRLDPQHLGHFQQTLRFAAIHMEYLKQIKKVMYTLLRKNVYKKY